MRPWRDGASLLVAGLLIVSCATPPRRSPAAVGSLPPAAETVRRPGPAPHVLMPPSPLTEEQQILQVLNRLGYGPRPGDVERVKRMGLVRYIEQQLDPASISDPAADESVRVYRTLTMSAPDLVREYPRPKPEEILKRETGEMARKDMADASTSERRPPRI